MMDDESETCITRVNKFLSFYVSYLDLFYREILDNIIMLKIIYILQTCWRSINDDSKITNATLFVAFSWYCIGKTMRV